MSSRKYEETEIKRQSYWRLLKYTAPYKYRLAIGILAGLLAGGSLFGSLMMIPQLMKGIEDNAGMGRDSKLERSAEAVLAAVEAAGPSKEERLLAAEKALAPDKGKDKIAAEIDKWRARLDKWGFQDAKLSYEGGNVVLKWRFIDVIFPAADKNGKMTWQLFGVFVLCFIFMWFFKNLGSYINHYFTRWVGTKVVADLRNEAFRKLVDQSLRFHGKMDVGQMISRCTNDTAAIESSVANSIADATRCPMELLACVSIIIMVSIQNNTIALPLILFIGLPICVLPIVIIGRRIRKIYKKSFAQIAEVVMRMHEVFTSILIVKAYHAESKEIAKFEEINRGYVKTVVRALRAQLLMDPLMEVVAVSATLVFLTYAYSQGVTLTEIVVLMAPCFMAYMPVKNLAKVSNNIQRSMAGADRYFNLIDVDTSIKEKPDAKEIKSFEREIKFQDVVFAYDQKRILDNLSLTIPKGHVVAVVGETGSGKTTIANLIARFYDVDGGSVSIDGVDVRDMKIASLRDMIGIITQEALLFNDTVANNIAYGCPGASRERIVEAAKQARAHEFIADGRHREGYDSVVGEKGRNLSGGEKQRISIARAILKNPPILILDEATSALDTVTEQLVQDALNRVMENRTVFAIAHRLSTIKHANMIIVLEKGRIVESGTHEQLMAASGRYKKLHDTQFGVRGTEGELSAQESQS